MTLLRSAVLLSVTVIAAAAQGTVRLADWTRGFALEPTRDPGMKMYLWFYEWNMFEAMKPGAHTGGRRDYPRRVSPDGREAAIESEELTLRAKAVADGAELVLTARNRTSQAWPELAGIIPCFSPGQQEGKPATLENALNPRFTDPDRRSTWFVSPRGLEVLDSRAIHFNRALRSQVDREAAKGKLPWDEKWPASQVNASEGVLIRESADGKWVAGIAWEDFLSAQGHNPWYCMHLAVRVGPLRPGETKTIRGRLFLFPGNRAECLRRVRQSFGKARQAR
jgi:hypothetical protein